MEKEIIKEYSNGDLTIIWKPKKCIHSEICWKTLPEVYDPKGKPWINPENATKDTLKSQISKCPSGALTYKTKSEESIEKDMDTECTIVENGPLLVSGNLKVTLTNGTVENKKRSTAFCRCGASANKPYCDGSHKKIEFKG